IDGYATLGVTKLHTTDAGSTLHLSATQAAHIVDGGITVANTVVTVTDTGSALSALSATTLGNLVTAGFTGVVDTSGTITWSYAQLQPFAAAVTLGGNALNLTDNEATL